MNRIAIAATAMHQSPKERFRSDFRIIDPAIDTTEVIKAGGTRNSTSPSLLKIIPNFLPVH